MCNELLVIASASKVSAFAMVPPGSAKRLYSRRSSLLIPSRHPAFEILDSLYRISRVQPHPASIQPRMIRGDLNLWRPVAPLSCRRKLQLGTVVFNDALPVETICNDVVTPRIMLLYTSTNISNCLLYTI